eukprot:6909151-Prymnesium_polylepis.1
MKRALWAFITRYRGRAHDATMRRGPCDESAEVNSAANASAVSQMTGGTPYAIARACQSISGSFRSVMFVTTAPFPPCVGFCFFSS